MWRCFRKPRARFRPRLPVLLGLTGSIAMGKSTAARMLRRLRVPVFDSDGAVHRLLAAGGAAVSAVAAAFPGSLAADGGIDRGALGRQVFHNPVALRQLETLLHPRVWQAQRQFLAAVRRRRRPVAVLDIPLLFETGGDTRVDQVLVVSAPARIQRSRVLARPGMTGARLTAILARQVPDAEKRRRADWVIPSGLGRLFTLRVLRRVLAQFRPKAGRPCDKAGGP